MKKLFIAIFALTLIPGIALAKEPKEEDVKKELTAVTKAIYAGDFDLILKHTHEKVFEIVGGKEVFLTSIKGAHKQLKEAGISIDKMEIGEIDYFEGKTNEFLIIPTKISIKGAGGSDSAEGAQLGVKKKDEKAWKYVDLSALNEEIVREWFPDYPKDKKVPKG